MQYIPSISRLAAVAAAAVLCATPLAASAQEDMPGEGTTIHMARATWDTGWWHAEVYKQLFEQLGYEIGEVTTLDNPPFYQAVSQGDVDLWVNGWFPLHNTYEETFSQGAEKVGYVAKGGALQGYLIDRKTAEEHDINYVEDLTRDDIKKLFDSNGDGKADLVACPPGWGCEEMIAYHLEAYGWDEHFNAIKAGYSASMADAVGRFENGEPIFFYTWTPNWTVGVLKPGEDVVWLQVKETKLPEDQAAMADATKVDNLEGCRGEQPCNLGWPANDIRPVVNSEFLEENPAVRSLLESVQIPIADIFAQNAQMNEGADSPEDLEQQAADWIGQHQSEVDAWLSAARKAAQ